MNLKQAAGELGINYSTAKTIVQTFRQEHRIMKKPKRAIVTKRGLKRERRLIRALTKSKITKLINLIVTSELTPCENSEKLKSIKSVREQTTESGLIDNHLPAKHLTRVMSACQMVIFPSEEKGPKKSQITRAVSANDDEFITKKDIFQIRENFEEEFKAIVNYENLIMTRSKPKEDPPNPENEKLPSLNYTEQCTVPLVKERNRTFSFNEYESKILNSFNHK